MIDCHCHLADQRLTTTLDAVMQDSRAHGLRFFVMAGVSPDEWLRQKAIAARDPAVVTCFGLHPVWVAEHDDQTVDAAFAGLEADAAGAGAVGETGLDFRAAYKNPARKDRQRRLFRSHLEVAARLRKPLVLHVVHAHEEALTMVKEFVRSAGTGPDRVLTGMVHGFTGSREVARQWLDLGFMISLGTRILHKQNQKLKDLAAWLPADRLLVESDAPDQRPPDHAGSLNEPWTSLRVMAMIAAAKNIDAGALQNQILINAGSLFGREFSLGTSARE
jgi:TatD DNase family protein